MSRALGRLLDLASRWFERLGRILMYAALGTLRFADFRRGSDRMWRDADLDDTDIDAGFFLWEQPIVTRFVKPADRVLVVGCGMGRDLIAFCRMGCSTTGMEPLASARTMAEKVLRDRGLSATVLPWYVEDWTIDGEFDVISLLACPYSLIPGTDRRVAMLADARARLSPGGRILFSFLPSSNIGPRSERSLTLSRLVGRICRSDWLVESGDQFIRIDGEPLTFMYEHVFSAGELEQEVARAGLRIAFHDRASSTVALTA